MENFSKPEMLRCPLENVVLKSKLLDMGSPPYVLALALSPPNTRDIHNTVITLKEVGALYKYANDEYTIDDGDITFMGRIMAFLPLDVRLTRLIMIGYAFSALEESIIIGKLFIFFLNIKNIKNKLIECISLALSHIVSLVS